MQQDATAQTISLTSEALVSLSIAAEVPPPPLVMLQLGVDPGSEDARRRVAQICERGLRDVASLASALTMSAEAQQTLRQQIHHMCSANAFVSLRRSDRAGCTIIYPSELTIVDDVDTFGNHNISQSEGPNESFESYFSDVVEGVSSESMEMSIGIEDGSEPSSDQSSSGLSASEVLRSAMTRLVAISSPSKGELKLLQWWQTDEGFYHADVGQDRITLTPTSAADAIDLTTDSLREVSDGVLNE